jgi:hypothetical protein
MSTAQYTLASAAGEKLQDGSADVEVAAGALVLAPSGESVLRIPFGSIAAVTEPEPFTVRITLAGGDVIELSRLGVMRTQLLAELRDGRGDDAAAAAGAVGEAEVFSAEVVSSGAGADGLGPGPAEVRVYDDALLVTAAAGTERIGFSFVRAVDTRDYVITVEVAGRAPLILSRLGRRTAELADLLAVRLREARGRTAAFLGSLLPGLDPMALHAAAGLLRDGVAVPSGALDGIHPDLAGTLVRLATLPDRRDAVGGLACRAELAIGFRQLVSVRRPAVGATPWRDHAATPHIGEHESPGGSFRPGLAGMLAAGVMSGGPAGFGSGSGFGSGEGYGAFGAYWGFRALGAGMNTRATRPMTPRPDVTRGLLTPATEDLGALAVAGDSPTVLAFALGQGPGQVVYDVLNLPEPVTCVFPGELAAVNRALDDAGFRAEALAPTVRIPHDAAWADRIAAVLGG